MSNDNYQPLLYLGGEDYYTAAQVGPFNETVSVDPENNPHICLAAFVAFTLDGGYQGGSFGEDSPPAVQWLWGNFDVTDKSGRGWSLTTRASSGGQLQILARCTAQDGTVLEAAADVTGPGLASPFDRVILAGLWYSAATGNAADDALLALSLNGSLVAITYDNTAGVRGYLPSPYAARLGADPVTAALTSDNVRFISCGYGPVPNTAAGIGFGDFGDLAGSTWRAFYSGYANQSFLFQTNGYDWKHRYAVRDLAAGISGNISKNATGAYAALTGIKDANLAIPAAVLPDVGNQSPNPFFAISPFTPVQLDRNVGATATRLLGEKNIPYYTPPAFTYPVTPP